MINFIMGCNSVIQPFAIEVQCMREEYGNCRVAKVAKLLQQIYTILYSHVTVAVVYVYVCM